MLRLFLLLDRMYYEASTIVQLRTRPARVAPSQHAIPRSHPAKNDKADSTNPNARGIC